MSDLDIRYAFKGAKFNDARTHRYYLRRVWRYFSGSGGTRYVLWIMLNPSTADENVLDPTLRRCEAFSRSWGFDAMDVCNLYALRSTDPAGLWGHPDPVGQDNDAYMRAFASSAQRIVLGWGTHAKPERVAQAWEILAPFETRVVCLGRNRDGSPKHPLYLRADTAPLAWAP